MTLIAAGMALAASAELNLPTKTVNGVEYYYYEVQPKESIYSLTRKIGVKRADIMRCNPSAIDGLRPHQVLMFPVSEFGSNAGHEVCPEESPLEILEPSAGTQQPEVEALPKVAEEPVVAEQPETDEEQEVSVAVLLPFMLENERMTKSAENFTEFYRGLMMAVDTTASKQPELKISIAAFDTEDSAARVRSLLEKPEVRNATYIIAPDDSVSIERIAEVADETGATVVNLFAVRNDAHTRHQSVYQANIPHQMMYAKAVAGFIDAYSGYKPVILKVEDIAADKQAFVDLLCAEMDAKGIDYETMEFSGDLTGEMLAERFTPGQRYVFVPTAGSREMLARILNPLTELRSGALIPDDVRLFGYPEWIIVRGEQARKLHGLHTAIYSRFATDSDSYPVRRVGMRYEDWYGSKMSNAAPVYGLLGYDAGLWMLGNGEDYSGLQNSFTAGDVNSALYFIYFSPDGKMRVKQLD